MTTSDPTGMHDWHSDAYVEEWIESYRERDVERLPTLQRIANLIPFDPDDDIRVLDIGGGWGPVTSVVLATFPKARVVLHDFSEAMLDAARKRLSNYSDSVSYVHSDLMSPDWAAGLGQFEAVVSSIAIHNVRFPDRIKAIYGEVFPLVAPGGCFINLDHVASGELAGRAGRQERLMQRRQQIFSDTGELKALSEIGAETGRGGRLNTHAEPSREDLERIAGHERATLANQLRWLLEAGFDEAECFSRERAGVLMGAFRAPS